MNLLIPILNAKENPRNIHYLNDTDSGSQILSPVTKDRQMSFAHK